MRIRERNPSNERERLRQKREKEREAADGARAAELVTLRLQDGRGYKRVGLGDWKSLYP